jgi:hypothetical protein
MTRLDPVKVVGLLLLVLLWVAIIYAVLQVAGWLV